MFFLDHLVITAYGLILSQISTLRNNTLWHVLQINF